MARRQINTNHTSVSCAVCGRSLLRGEQATVFIVQGQRRNVCDLCTVRAAHDGWIREGVDDVTVLEPAEPRKRGSFRDLIRSRRPDQPLEPGGAEAILSPQPSHEVPAPVAEDHVFDAVEPEPPAVSPELRREHQIAREVLETQEPADTLYDERSVRGVPSNVDLKVARALELFNRSAHVRTVSGVSRSLGTPLVSAHPSLTEGSVVTIVVAWELSWYRFEVDLGDEESGVRIVGQGAELEDLDPVELEPNGAATPQGTLEYVTPVGGEQ